MRFIKNDKHIINDVVNQIVKQEPEKKGDMFTKREILYALFDTHFQDFEQKLKDEKRQDVKRNIKDYIKKR